MLRNYGRDILKIFISVIKISKRTENFMCTIKLLIYILQSPISELTMYDSLYVESAHAVYLE